MLLTFDNKVIFLKPEKRDILFEQIIEDIKIYPPSSDGAFEIKNKKNKEKYAVEFERVEQED
jgi:hypothetical protein